VVRLSENLFLRLRVPQLELALVSSEIEDLVLRWTVQQLQHEIWKLVVFAFKLFNPQRHALEFLQDTILLNHLLMEQLEAFSKGKVLKVKTQKVTRRKKKKN